MADSLAVTGLILHTQTYATNIATRVNWLVICPFIFIWLVVRNMAFIFSYIGNVIIPTDEPIFFRGVETTNRMITLGITS